MVALSADGKRALTAGNLTATLWDVDSGREIRAFKITPAKIVPPPPSILGVYVIDIDGKNLRPVTSSTERVYLGGSYLFATKLLLP